MSHEVQEFNPLPLSGDLIEFADRSKRLSVLPRKPFDRQRVIAAFDQAFELIGGVPRLAHWAHANPTDFYKIYGKLLPQGSQIDINAKGEFVIRTALGPSPLDEIEGEYKDVTPP
jgi:hypothetical protein